MINEQKIRKFAKENLNLAVVPECLTSSLETVMFEKVNGGDQELFLAEFLMEKSKSLKTMILLVDSKLEKAESIVNFVTEKLSSYKKGSSFDFFKVFCH